jgi:hypothetical protein
MFTYLLTYLLEVFDVKKMLMFELIHQVPVGSGIRFKNSDLQDSEPDQAENGPDPQPWLWYRVMLFNKTSHIFCCILFDPCYFIRLHIVYPMLFKLSNKKQVQELRVPQRKVLEHFAWHFRVPARKASVR